MILVFVGYHWGDHAMTAVQATRQPQFSALVVAQEPPNHNASGTQHG